VTVNLSDARSNAPLMIVIRVPRGRDIDAACKLAQRVAGGAFGAVGVLGCLLTRIRPTARYSSCRCGCLRIPTAVPCAPN
jgi:hypothetical protein